MGVLHLHTAAEEKGMGSISPLPLSLVFEHYWAIES